MREELKEVFTFLCDHLHLMNDWEHEFLVSLMNQACHLSLSTKQVGILNSISQRISIRVNKT